MPNSRYDKLTASQKEAVFHREGPLLVIAGPGSGKTRVITYRIAALIESGVSPHNICAITFTNKAAEEMRQRAISLGASGGAHISTFHSLCVRILRRYGADAGINPNFSIYDDSDQSGCMKQAIKDCELDTTNFSPARMLDAISALKNRLIDAETFEKEAEDFFSRMLAKIYIHYQGILTERNAMDFDDLLMKTATLLQNNSDVCRQLGERFRFLLVDEYQDTNHAQYRIARTIVSGHNNICVTGDPDQSIYRWRGADIRNILAFEKDWPDATVVRLEENFRSSANILKAADKLISFNRNRKEKKLIPVKPAGKDIAAAGFEDELEESEAVAREVKELIDEGTSPRDIAVFYRVNAMSRVLEEAFIKNKIPYQIVRGVEFYGRKEVRDMLAYLKVVVNPDDKTALLRIINNPARGIGKTTIDKISEYADSQKISFYEALKKASHIVSLSEATKAKQAVFISMIEQFKKDAGGKVAPLMERVFAESGLAESLKGEQNAIENVSEMISAAAQYDQQTEEPSLSDYLQQISLFSDVDSYDTNNERTALMTLHCAKGLEFENVFIVGVEEGLLPHEKTDTNDADDLEEERRLFFVGITRAKSSLHISYARYRTIRGQLMRTVPSQFLYELGIDFAEHSRQNNYSYDETDDAEITAPFAAGQLVRHKSFGTGVVKEFVDMGENSVVVVRFNTGQTKTLMVKYAGLSKMQDNAKGMH
jgi:DNA helicase-2/ATP-dependent DNA helicase PcrA